MRLLQTACCAALLSLSGAAHAAVLLSDNFDSETLQLNYVGFANWNVTNGTVDLVGTGFFEFYPGQGRYVDLDGSTGDAGVLTSKTTFTLNPGAYTLSFRLGGSTRGDTNAVTVQLGSVYNEVFTLASSDPMSLITRTINVLSATTGALSFSNAGGDNLGAILDDVRLEDAARVPEPATLGLLGAALLGLGLTKRRRG